MIQVGTIFIRNRPLILRTLELESKPYSGTWDVLHWSCSSSLVRRIRDVGWNCFVGAAEVKATVLGNLAAGSVHRALTHIFAKIQNADFNCLEVIKISDHRFFGMPYVTVYAHSRHIQRGFMVESAFNPPSLQSSFVNSN
jgi:hypothetical protein